MNHSPFFSLIIPVYNVEEYLSLCLDSVFRQTFKNFELIVVNDGSTDHSASIISAYQIKYPEMVVFTQENKGQGAARNVALNKAKGDYIWFIDADDSIPAESLTLLYSLIKSSLTAVQGICFTYKELEVAGAAGIRNELSNCGFDDFIQSDTYDSTLMLSALFKGQVIPMCCNKIFSRKTFEQSHFQFLPGIFFEDVCFSIQMMSACEKIMVIREDLYVYNRRMGSTTVSACSEKHVYSIFTALHEVSRYLKEFGIYDKFESDFVGFYWRHLTFVFLTLVKDSDIDKNILFLDELSKSTASLNMRYYIPATGSEGDFPFAVLLKFISESELMNEEMESKLIESFNFPQEFIDTYM